MVSAEYSLAKRQCSIKLLSRPSQVRCLVVLGGQVLRADLQIVGYQHVTPRRED